MAGLVAYGSSDEESEAEVQVREVKTATSVPVQHEAINGEESKSNENGTSTLPTPLIVVAPPPMSNAPVAGPSLGPSSEEQDFSLPEADDIEDAPPRSPYSASAALRRELTMPSVPNFDIPPSPPGAAPEATEKKFAHFLKLKTQGIHFHDRLLQSSAFHNPSLMDELMEFAGISETDQYATTLPKFAADPTGYPKWAYKDELAKSQDKERKRREQDALGKPREFVAAVAQGDVSSSGTPTSSGARANGESQPGQVAGVKRKSRFGA